MTFEEIDRALTSWNQRLAAIADNLLELQSDPTYQVLTGSGGTTPVQLAGETARRVNPALKPIETIFHQFSLLQSVVDRAAQMRKDMRTVFGRDQTLKEIEALLLGESIQLPKDAVSLKDRTLLSGAQGSLTMKPEALLASMAQAYSVARDAVLTVSTAWDELAHETDRVEAELRRVQALVLNATANAPASLTEAERTFAAVKKQVETDPLQAQSELRKKLLPGLADAARELETRRRVAQQMAAARSTLQRLRHIENGLQAAAAERTTKILGPVGDGTGVIMPSSPPSDNLEVWLARLEARSRDERADTIARGLENWQKALNKAVEESVQALQRERAPLETRSELRGRLDALKAKARIYGIAEDEAVAGLAQEAEVLLYARPTDLARSAAAVEAFERRLALPTPSRQRTGSDEERR